MRSIQFSGMEVLPWGKAKVYFDDDDFSDRKIQTTLNTVSPGNNIPADTFVLLQHYDDSTIANLKYAGKDKIFKAPQQTSEETGPKLLREIAAFLKSKFN